MNDPVSASLQQFQEKDFTVKVCRLLFENLPKAPPFAFYRDLDGAAQQLGLFASAGLASALVDTANSEPPRRTIWVADKLDLADATLATYAGVSNIFSWFTGGKPGGHAFESDRPQAIDAVLKIIGVSYMANKLFEGTVREKAAQLLSLPAGREMILYLCVAEVALPFFDNVVAGGWEFASKHLQPCMAEGASKFGQVTGEQATQDLKGMFDGMNNVLGQTMGNVHSHLGPVAEKLKATMPTILNVTDSATGLLATSLDALPVWRFLGARLAAEAVAQRAGGALATMVGENPFGVVL
jgi:hypothetical protein